MFFRRKKPEAQAEDSTRESKTLYLHIAENGWNARVTGPDGASIGDDEFENVSDPKAEGSDRTEIIIKDAVRHFSKRRLRDVGSIHMLLDEQDVLVIDGKEQSSKAPNPMILRELGSRKLNVEQTTYGTRKFGLSGRREGKSSGWANWDVDAKDGDKGEVFAFLESAKLENYLSQLDVAALKLASVVPVVDVLLRRIEALPQVASACIYMADHNTYLAMGFPDMGMASIRTIPIGIHSFVDAVAKAQSVSAKVALSALSNRDYISSIDFSAQNSTDENLTSSVYDRALAPLLSKFFGEINSTLEYYSEHRAAGPISCVEIIGALDRVKGIRELFEANIHGAVTFPAEGLLEKFVSHVTQGAANLLSGSDGSLLSVGRTRYSYSENKFVETEVLAQQRAEIETEKSSKVPEGRVSRFRGNKGGRSGSKVKSGSKNKDKSIKSKGAAPKKEGFLSRARGVGKSAKVGDVRQQGAMDKTARKQDRAGVMLVLLSAFGILYFAWTKFESVSIEHLVSVSALQKAIDAGAVNRQEAGKKGTVQSSILPVADKVLWSEKFLSLSKNMDRKMWFTDVYLSDEQRDVGGENILSKKLVLEGAVLPSTDGHIKRIANFIERLLEDEEFFMNDFRDITFEGAERDLSESDDVVRFTLDAWYDENKRINLPPGGGAGKLMGIDQMQSNVDKRTEALDKVVP